MPGTGPNIRREQDKNLGNGGIKKSFDKSDEEMLSCDIRRF